MLFIKEDSRTGQKHYGRLNDAPRMSVPKSPETVNVSPYMIRGLGRYD